MRGKSSHGTFRKRNGEGLHWLFSFRLMVSVFGAVILASLISLALVLKRMRNDNIVFRDMVLTEQGNLLDGIEEKLVSLERRAGVLEARSIEMEAIAANTPTEGGAQVPVETLRSLIRLLGQHEADIAEIDKLMQQLPEEERNALSEELEAAESGSGHSDLQQPSGTSLSPLPPNSTEDLESGPVEAHGSAPIFDDEASIESLGKGPKPAEFIEYKVQIGDTLSAIALLHGAPVTGIMELNGIEDPNQIRVGFVLRIPSPGNTP